MASEDEARRQRAAARLQRVTLHRVPAPQAEVDLHPLSGEAAVLLAIRLTQESWALSGRPWPAYSRAETPYRFVPGWPRD